MIMQLPQGFDAAAEGLGAPAGNVTLIAQGADTSPDPALLPAQGWLACWTRVTITGRTIFTIWPATRYSDAEAIGKAAHHRADAPRSSMPKPPMSRSPRWRGAAP